MQFGAPVRWCSSSGMHCKFGPLREREPHQHRKGLSIAAGRGLPAETADLGFAIAPDSGTSFESRSVSVLSEREVFRLACHGFVAGECDEPRLFNGSVARPRTDREGWSALRDHRWAIRTIAVRLYRSQTDPLLSSSSRFPSATYFFFPRFSKLYKQDRQRTLTSRPDASELHSPRIGRSLPEGSLHDIKVSMLTKVCAQAYRFRSPWSWYGQPAFLARTGERIVISPLLIKSSSGHIAGGFIIAKKRFRISTGHWRISGLACADSSIPNGYHRGIWYTCFCR